MVEECVMSQKMFAAVRTRNITQLFFTVLKKGDLGEEYG
jgi:hypothetical protein